MNFNEIGLKDLVLDFDSNDLQDITIVQGDTKTRGFKVLVSTNNGEIIKASSQYEMRLYGVNSNYPDKSFFTKGTIDGDFYKVYISTDMASKSGKLQLQLALFEGKNALIQSRIKEVDVYRSIANGGNVGKDLVVDFGKLQDALDRADEQSRKFDESLVRQQAVESQIAEKHTEVVQIRDGLKDVLTTENARVEAEKKRVSAENTRASQESTRTSNEATRQSNETTRQQNESTRTSNEQQRQADESTRKSDEQKRISAESSRNSEESKRDNAEKIRVENENKRISAEKTRAENDTEYNKNEEQRQTQESTRQTQEQQRVDAEKLRQSQEDTRKQSEDTRVSQEKTRQTQEQSRVDAESKRTTSETSRRQTEQTRNINETERQNAEQTRQSNEQTRVSQETDRVEAEKKRAAAESDRAGKFAGWDKTMQGVIPTATSTVAGIVRIDVDGETVAASKKTVREELNALSELHRFGINQNMKNITEIEETLSQLNAGFDKKLNLKADKKDVDESFKEFAQMNSVFVHETNTTLNDVKSKISTNTTEIDNTKEIANSNSKSISTLSTTLDNKADKADVDSKADKTHTHKIADVDGLQNTLDNHERIFNSNIGSISDLSDKLLFKANNSYVTELDDRISDLNRKVDRKVSSDTVKNIAIIEKGASTANIPANSLIFEKE